MLPEFGDRRHHGWSKGHAIASPKKVGLLTARSAQPSSFATLAGRDRVFGPNAYRPRSGAVEELLQQSAKLVAVGRGQAHRQLVGSRWPAGGIEHGLIRNDRPEERALTG